MNINIRLWLYFSLALYISAQEIINLDMECIKCLCHAATGCNHTIRCIKGYCGPFKISKLYWIDAGNVTLDGDDPEREGGAYEDCSSSYHCASRIVANYFLKYGRDCNNDGVTNCEDYSMINFNGGYGCSEPLERNEAGRNWDQRFRTCYKRNEQQSMNL